MVLFNFILEGAAGYAEIFGRLFPVSRTFGKSAENLIAAWAAPAAVGRRQVTGCSGIRFRDGRKHAGRDYVNLPGGSRGHHNHPFNKIPDFPDIAGPVVFLDFLQYNIGKAFLDIIFLAEIVEKVET